MNNTRLPMAVRSPCVKVCRREPAPPPCLGCCRPEAERDAWAAHADARQRAVLSRCEQRCEVLVSREGGFAPGMGIAESRHRHSV